MDIYPFRKPLTIIKQCSAWWRKDSQIQQTATHTDTEIIRRFKFENKIYSRQRTETYAINSNYVFPCGSTSLFMAVREWLTRKHAPFTFRTKRRHPSANTAIKHAVTTTLLTSVPNPWTIYKQSPYTVLTVIPAHDFCLSFLSKLQITRQTKKTPWQHWL